MDFPLWQWATFLHKKIRTQADYFFGYPTAQGGASLSTR